MEKKKEDKIERVTFRVEDRMTYGVLNYDGNELMAAITGYDLNVVFNMRMPKHVPTHWPMCFTRH